MQTLTLAPRQREVLSLTAQGLTDAEIGARLGISPSTARAHLAMAGARLGIQGRVGLAVWYVRNLERN